MKLEEFLEANGLSGDPFAHTNAEEEDLLAEYFVPPPYFHAVRGNPAQPKSTVVFAPRGGGKTAQRRILEEDSRNESAGYLCILYDRFPVSSGRPSVEEHLDQICLRIVTALLVTLEEEGLTGEALVPEDREFLTNESALLEAIDAETFESIIQSLKSMPRKVGDFARNHSGPIKGIVAALLAKRGITLDPTVPWAPQMVKARQSSPLTRLKRLIEVCDHLGYSSIYVLVDRLDETAQTNTDPNKAIDLVIDMMLDLAVMELPGLAIKVFAWDLAEDHYHELGGRQDRIKEFRLNWSTSGLANMMARRLSAYSSGRVDSLSQLVDQAVDFNFHELASYLAQGSPREMILLCSRVVSEHLNRTDADGVICETDIWAGVSAFSAEIMEMRAKKFLPDLMRLNTFRFTQGLVASDYLKISKQAIGPKIAEWRKTGLLDKITEVQDKRRRPQHLYGVTDTRLAIGLRPSYVPRDVLEYFALLCPHCSHLNFSDENGMFICAGCQSELSPSEVPSLMAVCANPKDQL